MAAETGEIRAQVIELRFFGGLSVEETAAVLGFSEDITRLETGRHRAAPSDERRKGECRDNSRERRLEELHCGALNLDAGERDEFLRRACGRDAELRRAVESLQAMNRSWTVSWRSGRNVCKHYGVAGVPELSRSPHQAALSCFGAVSSRRSCVFSAKTA